MAEGIEWQDAPAGDDPLVSGLWRRLRDVLLVARRVETYTFAPGAPEARRRAPAQNDATPLARDFVLRALRAASDSLNYAILSGAASEEAGALVEDLAGATREPRLVVTERISDLVQVGLMSLALDEDRAHATPAGRALVAWIVQLADEIAERIRKTLTGSEDDGLPIR